MRLSEEKIEKIAGDLADMLEDRGDLIRFQGNPRLDREIARFIVADLRIEDEINQEAMARMETYSREMAHGTTEWTILLEKHKNEIAARRGYVI
jgi:hypothetical protein